MGRPGRRPRLPVRRAARGRHADLHRVVTAIGAVCEPDHMNVESLGNLMPHLHWHVIPRYKNDGRWRKPIWAQDLKSQPERRLPDDDRARLLAALRAAL